MWKFYCDCCGIEINEQEIYYKVTIESKTLKGFHGDGDTQISVCKKCANKVKQTLGEFTEME